MCITFVQCRPNVLDVGQTLCKCYTNTLCSLGYCLLNILPLIGTIRPLLLVRIISSIHETLAQHWITVGSLQWANRNPTLGQRRIFAGVVVVAVVELVADVRLLFLQHLALLVLLLVSLLIWLLLLVWLLLWLLLLAWLAGRQASGWGPHCSCQTGSVVDTFGGVWQWPAPRLSPCAYGASLIQYLSRSRRWGQDQRHPDPQQRDSCTPLIRDHVWTWADIPVRSPSCQPSGEPPLTSVTRLV